MCRVVYVHLSIMVGTSRIYIHRYIHLYIDVDTREHILHEKKNNQKPSVLNCLGPANNGRQLENFVEEVFPKRDAVDVPLHSQVDTHTYRYTYRFCGCPSALTGSVRICMVMFVLSCILVYHMTGSVHTCLYCHVFLFITDLRECIVQIH